MLTLQLVGNQKLSNPPAPHIHCDARQPSDHFINCDLELVNIDTFAPEMATAKDLPENSQSVWRLRQCARSRCLVRIEQVLQCSARLQS